MTASTKRIFWTISLSAALIASVGMGIRQNFGHFLTGMTVDLEIGRETFAFAMALQNLMWGMFSPITGAIADKYGSARMIALGGMVYIVGLTIMANAEGAFGLNLGAGLFIGFAQAAAGFAVLLGAVARRVSLERRSLALGITTAGGSFGQFYMAPASLGLIETFGWSNALLYLGGLALVMVAMAPILTGKASEVTEGDVDMSLGEAIKEATANRSYWMLMVGFFVCGFQVAFVAVHLPAFITDLGLGADSGAMAIGLIGLFNIIGTYTFGALGGKYSKKYLLSILYVLRSAVIAVFLLAPVSELSVLIFSASLGLLWLGTVPLTSGLVAQIFGVRYMSTLFGVVFFAHQLGSFSGIWWGGVSFDATGSYDQIWITSIILGILAGFAHLPIAEKPLRPVAETA